MKFRRLGVLLLVCAAHAAFPVSHSSAFFVTDALGRRVDFDRVAERVVLAGRGVFMVVNSLYLFPEARPRVIAVEGITQGRDGFLQAIDPGFCDKVVLPPEAGPEEIAALRPDLVVLKSYMEQKLGRKLQTLGIRVVYLDLETPEQFERDILTLGTLFQNEGRAAEVVSFYRERTDMVERRVSGIPRVERPRVLLLYYSERDGTGAFNVPPDSWMQTVLVERAGGLPLWKGSNAGKGWTKVGFEQIAAWNPDYVFVTAYFSDVEKVVRRLYADRAWSLLAAARGRRICAFPHDYFSWDQPDPRWILGLEWLAHRLHPGSFAGLDIVSETGLFFKEVYLLSGEEFTRGVQPVLGGDLN